MLVPLRFLQAKPALRRRCAHSAPCLRSRLVPLNTPARVFLRLCTANDAAAPTAHAHEQPTAASDLQEEWRGLLRVLYRQGHFNDAKEEALHVYTEVKWALLQFARQRTDAIFAFKQKDLQALAQVPLIPPPKGRIERKLANADARLKATYAPSSLQHAATLAQGDASLQDVLRVLWEWCSLPAAEVEQHAPGLPTTIRSMLQTLAATAQSEPLPEHVARAEQLGSSTPSTSQMGAMMEGKEAHRAAKEERRQSQSAASSSDLASTPDHDTSSSRPRISDHQADSPPMKKARWGRRGQRRQAERQAGSGRPFREDFHPPWASRGPPRADRREAGVMSRGQGAAAAAERDVRD